MQRCIDSSNELADGGELYVKIKNLEWMKALFILGKSKSVYIQKQKNINRA